VKQINIINMYRLKDMLTKFTQEDLLTQIRRLEMVDDAVIVHVLGNKRNTDRLFHHR
jgi:hypothetical protein